MSKHTPGPWSFDPPCETGGRWTKPLDLISYTTNHDGLHLNDADANLIAAAPDLLAELEAMVQLWDENHPDDKCACLPDTDETYFSPPCVLCNARNTIAKARGETP